MKQHHKVGNRPGQPAYRTASSFRMKNFVQARLSKSARQLSLSVRANKLKNFIN